MEIFHATAAGTGDRIAFNQDHIVAIEESAETKALTVHTVVGPVKIQGSYEEILSYPGPDPHDYAANQSPVGV